MPYIHKNELNKIKNKKNFAPSDNFKMASLDKSHKALEIYQIRLSR